MFAACGTVKADVVAKVNGGSPISAVSGVLTVNVGTVNGTTLIHVYDDDLVSGLPDESVDSIEIVGIVGTNAKIHLLIAENTQTTFPAPNDTLELLGEGILNLGDATSGGLISFSDGTDPSDALRDITEVAISVLGNIHADIDVGRVYRIQAASTGTGKGLITGDVTANADDDLDLLPSPANPSVRELGEYAINVITAARGIEGKVQSKTGAIARVQVTGVTTGVVGIANDIISAKDIASVFSAGPISATGSPIKIYAAGNIEQIRTIDSSGDLVTESAALDVRTGVYTDYPINLAPVYGVPLPGFTVGVDESLFTGNPGADAALGLLEIGGDAAVGINVLNLAPTAANAAGRVGILCRGALTGNINVQHNLDHSRIIAQSFASTSGNGVLITVGNRMTGVIIENDRSGFDAAGIFIGYGSKPVAYQEMIDGMTGVNCPPADMTSGDWPFTMADCDGKTFDSLIRVGKLKGLSISRMTLETELSPDSDSPPAYRIPAGMHKAYMPRVEMLFVKDLDIGAMEAGVVWSGNLLTALGAPENDTTNDYINIETADIGCISPTADIWVYGWHRFDIAVDLLGEVHVPSIPDNGAGGFRYLRIGERLGTFLEADRLNTGPMPECHCGSTEQYNNPSVEPCDSSPQYGLSCTFPCPLTPSGGESSPRAFSGGDKFAPIGRIHVREPNQLIGHVVVNANNVHQDPYCPATLYNASSFWTGKVEVKRSAGSPHYNLQPTGYVLGGCCYTAQPVHQTPVQLLGYGDVGEVPFRIHAESSSPGYGRDCDPVDAGGYVSAEEIVDYHWLNLPIIKIRYDGPIAVELGTLLSGTLAKVYLVNPNNTLGTDVTHLFSFDVDPSEPRELRLTGESNLAVSYVDPDVAVRRYRVVVERGLDSYGDPADFYQRLICHTDALFGNQIVPVSEETFDFRVFPDCNGNKEPDPEEIEEFLAVGTIIDCNQNGLIDACEILADPELDQDEDGYLDYCQNGCYSGISGDYDCNSVIDAEDLLTFVSDWLADLSQTVPPASATVDVDGSGSIDVADLYAFFDAWLNNCGC